MHTKQKKLFFEVAATPPLPPSPRPYIKQSMACKAGRRERDGGGGYGKEKRSFETELESESHTPWSTSHFTKFWLVAFFSKFGLLRDAVFPLPLFASVHLIKFPIFALPSPRPSPQGAFSQSGNEGRRRRKSGCRGNCESSPPKNGDKDFWRPKKKLGGRNYANKMTNCVGEVSRDEPGSHASLLPTISFRHLKMLGICMVRYCKMWGVVGSSSSLSLISKTFLNYRYFFLIWAWEARPSGSH